jgi:hypothetical protein
MIKEIIRGDSEEDHSWVGFEDGSIVFGVQYRDALENPSRLKNKIFFSESVPELYDALNRLNQKLENL